MPIEFGRKHLLFSHLPGPHRTGRTRFDRLYLIGCSSAYLSIEALKAAIVEAKKGRDVGRYLRAVETLHSAAPGDPEATLDTKWIEMTSKKVALDTERMEAELKGYKNNLIKESIRVRLSRWMCYMRRDLTHCT